MVLPSIATAVKIKHPDTITVFVTAPRGPKRDADGRKVICREATGLGDFTHL